jgi:hypothetical protein
MIPPSWRICSVCGCKHDVERINGRYLCFDCRLTNRVTR